MIDTIFGYQFQNPTRLDEALTTPSYRMTCATAHDNQRLEFLGDAVLGFLAADYLHARFPNALEGELTVMRTQMVSTSALCAAAERLNLAPLLKRNRGAQPLPAHAKVYADAIEAIIGAAWLDGGLDAAREIFANLQLDHVNEAQSRNPKGELQILAQSLTPPQLPVYTLVSVAGKAHQPDFLVRVSVESLGSAEGAAHSRKEAEARAAENLLSKQISV